MATAFFVGVSGFSYPSWRGRFYQKETKSDEFLSYYSKHLGSVEINSSFYAPPREAVLKGWAGKTGERFVFSFKAPQLITHVLKLGKGSAEATDRFSRTIELLGPRRGAVLLQLPPYSRLDETQLEDFLGSTTGTAKKVFEFRHESWFQDSVYRLLEKYGAGFCISETEDLKPVFQVTGGRAYFRLRRDSYDEKSVNKWAVKIRETAKGLSECCVYLRHDETGENAVLAQKLTKKLEGD